jgi:precorrin-6Y C5,15-methyltransferase (decarboxylating)
MAQNIIYLIGTGIAGCEGLSAKALEAIGQAEILVGRQRHLDRFPDFPGETMLLGDLPPLLTFLQATDKRVAVLATGDPNFFGTGRFLLRNLPKERLEIFANVTSMQYAFARIKEPWDDAIFLAVKGRGMGPSIDKIVAAEKACILTDEIHTPAAVAKELLARGAEGYEAWVCEDLGLPTEKFTRTDVKGLVTLHHSDLNILILIRTWEPNLAQYPLIGIGDDEFTSFKKLFTRQEVRAVTLAKLKLQNDLVVWDIGAGSGSVSIEASNLIPNGKLFAIEKNSQYVAFLKQNLDKFCAHNVKLIEAFAPEGLDDLPDPDRVFIGGAGGNLEEIIEQVDRRIKSDGIIVINAVTLDTLTKSIEALEYHGYQIEVVCINVSRTRPLTEFKLFEAHTPVYIITAWKGAE